MKKQKGITLIALVISIIVMLILAGVSINAIVGKNGVLSRAQYSSFMNEMAAVEEAVQLWKAGELMESKGRVSTAIPANGLCKVNDLTSRDRLVGEIGYYRNWSVGKKVPDMSILSSTEDFNKKYEIEFIYYPAGVQDLYYLNNEALDLDKDKVYLIDAATSMVYSTTGITLNGVKCYSTYMAKAVMGNNIAPLFTEAEVSGGGDNIVYAGAEYLKDKNGNYIDENGNIVSEENKILNPYGFEIITSLYSDNIYKLYNTGELYAKGVKGTQLSTDTKTMEEISDKRWVEFTIPSEIGEYKKIIRGHGTIFVIDKNDELWAWGNNSSNKLGLSQEQLIEYTGREAIKLNVDNKKVKKVFSLGAVTFVITTTNQLYACGGQPDFYMLGNGKCEERNTFEEIIIKDPNGNIKSPDSIKYISSANEGRYFTYIQFNDNTFYACGVRAKALSGTGATGTYKYFVPILNGYAYNEDVNGNYIVDEKYPYNEECDVDEKVVKMVKTDAHAALVLLNDNTLWHIGIAVYVSDTGTGTSKLVQLAGELGEGVVDVSGIGYGYVLLKDDGRVFGANGLTNCLGLGRANKQGEELPIPENIKGNIKDLYVTGNTVLYVTTDNDIYGSSSTGNIFGLSYQPEGIIKLDNLPTKIIDMYNFNDLGIEPEYKECTWNHVLLFKGEDNKIYSINNNTILFRNSVLQSSWVRIAENVNKVALGPSNSIAYVDKNNNLYVAGNDSRLLNQNTSIQSSISQFTRVDDVLINSKVKEVKFSTGQMYILTTENDLYATGLYCINGTTDWPNGRSPGWEEESDSYTLKLVLNNVSVFDVKLHDRIAVSNGKLYSWGMNYGQSIGQKSMKKTEWNVGEQINIEDIIHVDSNYCMTTFITKEGSVYTKGPYHSGWGNIGFGSTEIVNRNNLFNNEKIIDEVSCEDSYELVLTENGNVYVWGERRYLCEGSNSKEAVKTPKKIAENIVQISAGNGFFILVDKSGKVYGTGTNQYGILGRWIGVDRTSPNSRYKTAYELVECPELEI